MISPKQKRLINEISTSFKMLGPDKGAQYVDNINSAMKLVCQKLVAPEASGNHSSTKQSLNGESTFICPHCGESIKIS